MLGHLRHECGVLQQQYVRSFRQAGYQFGAVWASGVGKGGDGVAWRGARKMARCPVCVYVGFQGQGAWTVHAARAVLLCYTVAGTVLRADVVRIWQESKA